VNKPTQSYDTPEIQVTFDPNVCAHSGNCVRGLPSVFDLKRKPWIRADAATADAIEAQIAQCPSGALRFRRKPPPG
jgi:uncharacterized Fe-S cluster protein YjdI